LIKWVYKINMRKEDLEKEFTPEFLKEFMFDAEFRTIFESIQRGGSSYEMIEHLCKSKKEISELLEKMVINFGPINKMFGVDLKGKSTEERDN
jgi:hypothetical protein